MGTRSLTRVFESEKGKKEILCLYRQSDGYPSGMGTDLHKAFKSYGFCNGISNEGDCAQCGKGDYEEVHRQPKKRGYHEFKPKEFANGIQCFAATLVKKLKGGIGGVYIYAPGTKDAGQEFEYHLWLAGDTGPLMMKVLVPGYKGYGPKHEGAHPEKVLYNGNLKDFDATKCVEEEEVKAEA